MYVYFVIVAGCKIQVLIVHTTCSLHARVCVLDAIIIQSPLIVVLVQSGTFILPCILVYTGKVHGILGYRLYYCCTACTASSTTVQYSLFGGYSYLGGKLIAHYRCVGNDSNAAREKFVCVSMDFGVHHCVVDRWFTA